MSDKPIEFDREILEERVEECIVILDDVITSILNLGKPIEGIKYRHHIAMLEEAHAKLKEFIEELERNLKRT